MFTMIRPTTLALLLCLSCLFTFLSSVHAAPIRVRASSDSTTVTTVHSTMTPAGPMTETCVITLTPITDKNGQPAVEEVRRCKLTVDATNNPSSGGSSSSSTSESTTSSSATATTSTSSASSAATTSTAGGNGAISVNGFTTVTATTSTSASTPSPPAASTSTSSSSSSVTTSSSATTTNTTGPGVIVKGLTTIPAASVPTVTASGTAAADNTSSVSAIAAQATNSPSNAISVPGKSISVLPIGLGVFAGISVIALIVVGLVTYERTKYRKAFRQRKLAESGAAMGYGGMAQRSYKI